MPQKIVPCLWFDDRAEEAANWYVSIFRNSRIISISYYGKTGAEASGRPEGSVLTVEFEIEGERFTALNGGPVFKFTPAISLYVGCETLGEVDRLHKVLSEKGGVLMPLDKYPFSERYAWVTDRYGLSWQLFLGPSRQKITPCLLFVQNHYGKAAEAMTFYGSVFANSKIESIVPYDKSEGEKEGAIKHAVFSLGGLRFMAMDSGLKHSFSFTPAISFMVDCSDQEEVDRFWKGLSSVPEAEQCGWLMDKYGVSWQIVPGVFKKMIRNKDPAKTEKVMEAMIQMKKFNIKELELAYRHRDGVEQEKYFRQSRELGSLTRR